MRKFVLPLVFDLQDDAASVLTCLDVDCRVFVPKEDELTEK